MKKYDNYKDSGIEWIGEIPEHWVSSKVKFEILPKGYKAGPFGSSLITSELLLQGTIKVFSPEHVAEKEIFEEWYLPEERAEEMSQFLVKDKDVVLPIVGTLGLARVFNSSSDGNGIINQRLARISCNPIKLIPEYFCIIMKDTRNYQEYFQIQARGSILSHLNKETIVSMPLVLPEIEEQQLIINYLDHKTAQIDTLIAKKEQFISLLQEERTAIINQAVTKGLDPTVKMKDSGIEWLGEIPEHWEVKRMKFIANLNSGNNIISEQITKNAEFPVYGGNGLRGYYSEYTNDGDFILIGRQGALCGNINYATGKFWASEHAIVCYLNDNVDWIWFGKLLEIMNLNQYNQSAAQPGLAVGLIKNLNIGVPNIDEQILIKNFIEIENLRIQILIDKSQQEIELLKEYKTALISEVVTGKVDVRDVILN